MGRVLQIILIALLLLSVGLDAQARRFGGGKSIGMHRSVSSSTFTQKAAPLASKAVSGAASTGKKWLAPLAGLAIGALLGSMLFNHGLASGLIMWIGLFMLGFLIYSWLRSRKTASPISNAQQNLYSYQEPEGCSATENNRATPSFESASSSASASTYPEGFVPDEFLREMKVQFIRLQAASDAKNLNDIREFTTPEVFAEVQLQLHEEGSGSNKTEIISIQNELIDVQNEFQQWIASVRFFGELREDMDAASIQLNEIWHLKKDILSSKWLIAGIQQVS